MNNYGRLLMAIGLLILFAGALVNNFVGLSNFWHGMGWGLGIMVGLMLAGDLVKHCVTYGSKLTKNQNG